MGPRIVLDTNVLLSTFGWRGTPHEILRRTMEGQFRLLVSPALLNELERVLSYSKFHNPEDEVAGFLLAITEIAEILFAPSPLSAVIRDPTDDRVLECAVTGRADFIVSGDLHLKELKSFQGIPILSPAEFLQRFPS